MTLPESDLPGAVAMRLIRELPLSEGRGFLSHRSVYR